MRQRNGLYDCAVPDAVVGVGRERAIYIGTLDRVDWHAHGTPVLIAGMAGRIRLGLEGGRWHMCHAAIIPAGVMHTLELDDNPLAAVYVEPQLASVSGLARLGTHWEAQERVLVGHCDTLGTFREIYENRQSLCFAREALDDLLGLAVENDAPLVDPRVLRVVQHLADNPADQTSIGVLAAAQGLSLRRFMAMFQRDMGVRFRRYRVWNRIRAAIEVVLSGHTLTEAALATGFTDSPHFARQYHQITGVTPSSVLRRVARAGSV